MTPMPASADATGGAAVTERQGDALSQDLVRQQPGLAGRVHYVNGQAWCDGINHTTMCGDDFSDEAGTTEEAAMTEIPRWLELQAEIDYRIFLLNEMRREVETEGERLTPLDRLIDEATGHDEARLAEAEEIIAEIKTLKAEWDALNGDDDD